MQSLVNFAKQYAEHGFSVIPTIEKRPLIKFADREPLTVDEITKFWRTHPYANIALKTDKFFVIDVDRHKDGDDGTKAIKELKNRGMNVTATAVYDLMQAYMALAAGAD